MTILVHPSQIKVARGREAKDRDVRLVAKYIDKDGLIEPLKLDRNGEIGIIDCWDPARLAYCAINNWPTVIADFDDDEVSDLERQDLTIKYGLHQLRTQL